MLLKAASSEIQSLGVWVLDWQQGGALTVVQNIPGAMAYMCTHIAAAAGVV